MMEKNYMESLISIDSVNIFNNALNKKYLCKMEVITCCNGLGHN